MGSTTEEWYVTYDLFGKRRKRESTLSHNFIDPPNERYLKLEKINKSNQAWIMDKEVSFKHTLEKNQKFICRIFGNFLQDYN